MSNSISINIQQDQWLSEALQKKSFNLKITTEWINKLKKGDSAYEREFKNLLSNDIFVYTKINTTNMNAIALLEAYSFNLIETNITLEKSISKLKKNKTNTIIRAAEESDISSIGELGRDNIVYSRFHLDPFISLEIANELKSQWVLNFFKGERGDRLLVAELDNRVVGFNQLIFSPDNSLIVDLIAVDINYRRRGIASDLINHAEFIFSDKNKIIVGTQVSNIPSIRMYEKLGFRIYDSKYVFHYHKV